jgi:hypothetical protein
MQNEQLDAKKLEILQEQLSEHRKQDSRAGFLLKFALILTGLLYFMFEKHLFLGEAITWGAYFQEWHSALDFILMFVIVVMSAVFLASTKHHAYLHFGLYGSIGLVVFTVIAFALFAEFFSSSASQDTKSRVLLANDSAYQATIAPVATAASPALLGGNAAAIAKAEQTYARCKSNLGKPGYKHCNGDKATLDSLKASDAASLSAAKEIAIQSNTANQKATYERQDKLKADSYNAVIVSIARFIGSITGTDYKDNIKTAIVLTMLIVAVAFEILHHFLSHSKERSQNAVYGLELELAKYGGYSLPEKPESVIPKPDGAFKESSIGFTAPIGKPATAQHSPVLPAHEKPVFKYQRQEEQAPEKPSFGFVPAKAKAQPEGAEIRKSDGFRQSDEQLANVRRLADGEAVHAPTRKPLHERVIHVSVGDDGSSEKSSMYGEPEQAKVGAMIDCPQCGKTFQKANKWHTFCCTSCKDDWHNAKDPKRLEALKAKSRRKRA